MPIPSHEDTNQLTVGSSQWWAWIEDSFPEGVQNNNPLTIPRKSLWRAKKSARRVIVRNVSRTHVLVSFADTDREKSYELAQFLTFYTQV